MFACTTQEVVVDVVGPKPRPSNQAAGVHIPWSRDPPRQGMGSGIATSAETARSSLLCAAVAVGTTCRRRCKLSRHGHRLTDTIAGLALDPLRRVHPAVAVCATFAFGGEENEAAKWEREDDMEEGIGFSLAPWAEGVRARPIFVVSDCTGEGAQMMVASAWAQFGSPDAADMTVRPGVRSAIAVDMAVAEAASCRLEWDDEGRVSRALVVYMLASRELGAHLARECAKEHVACINALEPLLTAMEASFGQERRGSRGPEVRSEESVARSGLERSLSPAVFAVSCGSGNCTFHMVCAALRQFPQSGISEITVCPEMRSLEEVKLIVQKAAKIGALVAFTFASPGMSRFMRQQCELAGVRYCDLFQPVLVTMEIYLNHPFFGVPGGLDLKALAESELRWYPRKVV